MDMTLSTEAQILAAALAAAVGFSIYAVVVGYRRLALVGPEARRWRRQADGLVTAVAILSVSAVVIFEGDVRDRRPASVVVLWSEAAMTADTEVEKRRAAPATPEQIAALEGCARDAVRDTLGLGRMITREGLERIKERCVQEAQDQAREHEERAVVAAQRAALDGAGAAPTIR